MRLELISRLPSGARRTTPLLFVHGAWHGAWCWDVHFLPYFAQQGYAAHALSLRGHGQSEGRERLRWTRIADYVDDVATVTRQLDAAPVLIGHSMGSLVVQKFLEAHAAPGAALLASVPPAGVLTTTLRIAARHPALFALANLRLSLLPLVSTPALAREAFFSDALSETQVAEYTSRLQDESYLGFLDMLAFDLPRTAKLNSPLLVLGAQHDTIFSPHQVEATARAYGTRAEMFADMAHDMMLEPGWRLVAARILGWLGELEASRG